MLRLWGVLAAGLLAGCCCDCKCSAPTAQAWGTTKFGEEAHLYTINGGGDLTLVVSDFGGRVVKCLMPDRGGKVADITLGWNTVGEYEELGFCVGTLIGRFGNRIRDGKFTLDGKDYQLALNETTPAPRHCNCHSGPVGWDAKVWKAEPFKKSHQEKGVVFTLVSPDGDMGFPGTVTAKVTYTVRGNVWRLDYEATTDKPTVVNLTNHTYWNLAGEASGDVLGQHLCIHADAYTKTDAGLIPTEIAPVEGTGFDFRTARPIGAASEWMKAQPDLACTDNWYDHNFVLNGKIGELHPAVEMSDPQSGRRLEIWTEEPGLQMYGAQNMTTALPAKEAGKTLCPFAGLVFETQHYPDSPNRPDFPSTVLRPGETYRTATEYRFGVK